MREIKFRAYKKSESNMVSWNELLNEYSDDLDAILTGEYFEAVMQYTGLKDKNGVEIYEGDLARGHYGVAVGVVEYGEYGTKKQHKHDCTTKHIGWYLSSKEAVKSLEDEAWYIDECYRPKRTNNIEVIGNIHENGDLIDG